MTSASLFASGRLAVQWRLDRAVLAYWVPVLTILLVACLLRHWDPYAVERLRLIAFDTYQRNAPRTYDPALPVRIVDVDEASLKAIGQWPWPRTVLAELVRRLERAGAVVIAFDMVFPEPDRLSPAELARFLPKSLAKSSIAVALAESPSNDSAFAAAIAGSAVVMGFIGRSGASAASPPPKVAELEHTGGRPDRYVPAFASATVNLPELTRKVHGSGSINWVPEHDMIIRRVPLLVRVGDQLYPSLAAEALRLAQGISNYLIVSAGAGGEASFGAETGISRVHIGNAVVPTDAGGQMWLHFTPSDPRRFISAGAVLDGSLPDAEIKGRIILIGTSAAGLLDLRATPLDAAVPGVEVHAQAIELMLNGQHIVRPDFATGLEIVFIGGTGWVLCYLIRHAGATIALSLGALTIAAVISTSWLLFRQYGWLLDPIFPSLTLAGIYVAGAGVRHALTEAERKRVRNAFGHYMAPALVERLALDPSQLQLGGESRDVTLLFSDVRGFTGRSEGMDAQALTRFVNQLFTPLSDTIIANGGTIDKYMGDAVMAFWNAPLDDPAHAANACRAAMAMLRDLDALNRWWDDEARVNERDAVKPVSLGIGLNTGVCCVGNFGSRQRFDYSVIGDDVNLASRLESLTKLYGMPIVVGERTASAAPAMATLELDLISVKGKTQPVRVFALVGDERVSCLPEFAALRDVLGSMLKLYRGQQFALAMEQIQWLRQVPCVDLATLMDLYDGRIRNHLRNPPPLDWDGSAIAESK